MNIEQRKKIGARLSMLDSLNETDSHSGRVKPVHQRKYNNQSTQFSNRTRQQHQIYEETQQAGHILANLHHSLAPIQENSTHANDTTHPLSGTSSQLGNHLINLDMLDKCCRKIFCCRRCIAAEASSYLQDFFTFASMLQDEYLTKGKSIEDKNKRTRHYEQNFQTVSSLYRKFLFKQNTSTNKKSLVEGISFPVQ